MERRGAILTSTGKLIMAVLEEHLPAVSFAVMFVVFLLQVLFRYVLKAPLAWTHEISIFAFVWTILFGAALARRSRSHVAFGLVYDRMPVALQRICRLFGNGLIAVSMLILFVPSIEYLAFLRDRKSVALQIPFSLAYSPLLVFMLLMVWYSVRDIWLDLRPDRQSHGEADRSAGSKP